MDIKKSADANVDKLRLPFIAIGFLFVGSLVLASFSYTAGVPKDDQGDKNQKATAVKFEQEVKKEEDKPIETPPEVQAPPPVQEDIIIEENTDKIPPADVTLPDPPAPPAKEDKKVETKPEIIEFPDVEATFPGGTVEMMKWITANIEYPQMSIEQGDQGKVYVAFVVDAVGTISDIEVERGVSPELDREAKRMMRKMPKWVAGEAAGKKVPTRCRLPIVFTLN
ncbi:MAG: TonB family protein [Crocinitomicaceae bacterium]|jgi:periplasmic protein TonB|nr:TonB family protein [Crocinitomicaceae bacterium]MDG2464510.1 TonB family protein [Crocinitomicaceae bacterium]